jgi:hypothetical protein
MALLSTTTQTPAQAAASQVRAIIKQQYISLAQSGMRGWQTIWKNPAAKPAEVIAALGTDAEAIFSLAQINIFTLEDAANIGGGIAPALPGVPSEYQLLFAEDGSATLVPATEESSSGE